jgi:hypothetical protein
MRCFDFCRFGEDEGRRRGISRSNVTTEFSQGPVVFMDRTLIPMVLMGFFHAVP